MLLFSERRKIAFEFDRWAGQNKLAYSPLNVVTFLMAHDLLNEEKCKEFLKEIGGKNGTLHG